MLRNPRNTNISNLRRLKRSATCPETRNKSNSRQELAKADQPQIKCAVRNVVNLPSDRDGLHFGGSDYKKSRDLVENKSWIGERDPPINFVSCDPGISGRCAPCKLRPASIT